MYTVKLQGQLKGSTKPGCAFYGEMVDVESTDQIMGELLKKYKMVVKVYSIKKI